MKSLNSPAENSPRRAGLPVRVGVLFVVLAQQVLAVVVAVGRPHDDVDVLAVRCFRQVAQATGR